MRTKLALCCLTLLYGCSNPAPPAPTGSPSVSASPTAATNFSDIQGQSVEGIKGTPLTGGTSATLEPVIGTKLASNPGAYFPLLQVDAPDQVLLVFVPGVTPAELDKRPSANLTVSGTLKPIEDAALANTIGTKISGGKLFQKDGKPVYLEASSDPWPAGGSTASPGGAASATPVVTGTPQ